VIRFLLLMIRFLLLMGFALPVLAETYVGAGVRSRPDFDGSGERTTDLIPVIRYYGTPWFARTTQGILEGGARYAFRPGLEGGVQLAYEQGPRDEDPGASAGVHLELDTRVGPAPLNALARIRWHADRDRGAQADLRGTLGVYEGGGLRAGVFAQGTWSHEKHMQAYYGVRHAGLLYTSLGVLGSYDLGRRWLALASAERRRLSDEPGRSAFVEDRTNAYFSAGIAYRF
jgi:outer membrane scaffolding protein for murein synthesis (MipA/OmpV family)